MGSEGGSFRTMLNVPNTLSALRLLGVPLFLWLVLGPHEDGWALVVLALSGFTDWLDGQLARAWNQTSRLGELLDPIADRAYILAVVIGLTARGIIPIWFAVALLARDIVLLACGPVLRAYGYGALPVHFLGKAATFNLLYAFPLLLLGTGTSVVATLAKAIGWAFAIWGTALYWWAAVLYVAQVRQVVRAEKAARAARTQPATSSTAPDTPDTANTARPANPARPGHSDNAAGAGNAGNSGDKTADTADSAGITTGKTPVDGYPGGSSHKGSHKGGGRSP